MRLCANLTCLYTDLPMLDRIGAAARDGFTGAEILFTAAEDHGAIARACAHHGIKLVLINAPTSRVVPVPGNSAVPGAEAAFDADLNRALAAARDLNPQHIHVMSGAAKGPKALATFKSNLARAVHSAPDQSFLIEPINRADMPGYFLADFDLAIQILTDLGAPNLGLQFDAYHAHRITGDVLATWEKVKHYVRHIQVAGFPGRHEPMGGAIDYPGFFAAVQQSGYGGWISGEYFPAAQTEQGLGWMDMARQHLCPG